MADFTPIAYKISNSDYSYILENITFRLGDSLVFASGIEIHLINSDFTDSIIELQGINSNGIEGVIPVAIDVLPFLFLPVLGVSVRRLIIYDLICGSFCLSAFRVFSASSRVL